MWAYFSSSKKSFYVQQTAHALKSWIAAWFWLCAHIALSSIKLHSSVAHSFTLQTFGAKLCHKAYLLTSKSDCFSKGFHPSQSPRNVVFQETARAGEEKHIWWRVVLTDRASGTCVWQFWQPRKGLTHPEGITTVKVSLIGSSTLSIFSPPPIQF